VDKQRLTILLNEPHLLKKEDYKHAKAVKKEYPYFQAISPLLTIGAANFETKNHKQHLQSSAIYTFDRKHLKELLATPDEKAVPKTPEQKAVKPTVSTVKQDQAVPTIKVNDQHLPDSFFEELYQEMDKLKKSKEQYKTLLSKLENDTIKSVKAETKKEVKSSTKPKTTRKAKATTKTTTTSKAETKAKTTSSKRKTTSTAKSKKKEAVNSEEHHSIIDEIKLKEIKAISDEHLQEQINLITSFIEKEPSINKKMINHNVDAKRAIEDLSETSTHLSDDVISETLAKLMVKQDRKEKAIDIYKKLIWKFPQKKAYFADQIKKLKSEE
jgi:hypothetical protein